MLRLPLTIGAPPLEGGGFQHVVIVRQDADVLDADAVGDCHGSLTDISTKAPVPVRRAIWRRRRVPARHNPTSRKTPAPVCCPAAPSTAVFRCHAGAANLPPRP